MTTITTPAHLPRQTAFEQTTDPAKAQRAEADGRAVYQYTAQTPLSGRPVTWFFVEMKGGLK